LQWSAGDDWFRCMDFRVSDPGAFRHDHPLILGLGGTTREGSTTERALRVALRAAAAEGADTVIITAGDLVLPMFTTDPATRTPAAQRLVELYRRCQGLIIASPAYHGSVSGLLKNALDYAEDLRMDERAYFDGIAVGVIACAGGWQAAVQTMGVLREIAHALRGWPTPLGAALNTSIGLFDASGECVDLSSKFQLENVGRQVVQFAQMRRGHRAANPLAAS
jgi:FMN reductase